MKQTVIGLLALLACSCNNGHPATRSAPATLSNHNVDTGYVDPNTYLNHPDSTYCNFRYGYCVDYPSEAVHMQPEAPNGDGCVFHDNNNRELGRVYRTLNPDPEGSPVSLKTEMEKDIARLQDHAEGHAVGVTYSKVGKTFYVMSAKGNGRIYYHKCIVKGDDMAMLIFQYDEERKSVYNVIVAAMAKSFHW